MTTFEKLGVLLFGAMALFTFARLCVQRAPWR